MHCSTGPGSWQMDRDCSQMLAHNVTACEATALPSAIAGPGLWSWFSVVIAMGMLWLWRYRFRQRNRKEPKQWPVLGSAMEIVSHFDDMHDWLLSYFEKGLKSFRVELPGIAYTYTVDPANVEYILKTNFTNFPKGELYHRTFESLLGDGIFNTDGEAWRQQRKTASFEFASRVLRDYSTVTFREHSIMLAEILARASLTHQPVDMQDLFMRFTLDGICKVGFGVEIGTLSPSLPVVPFATNLDSTNEAVVHRFFDPLWQLKQRLNIGYEAVLARSVKVVDDFTYSVIKTRRAELEVTHSQGKEMKPDLLSRFIMLGKDSVQEMTDKALRDVILNFIIAGRDTTATTLSWFVYLLGNNPDVADKIYEEVLLLEEDEDANYVNLPLSEKMKHYASLLSYDVLSKLPYLHAAITETMRLYPAVPQNAKGILADDVLPDGTVVKKGGLVTYASYAQGRMTDLWGADANEFRPERFLQDGKFVPANPFKFSAFQAGPRICLGKDSAYTQMKMAMAILCRFYKFQLVPGHDVKYRMMATLVMEKGVRVLVNKR